MASKTIKFNAGKVEYDEETKRCTPLPHKGVISIKPNADDEDFFDFTWSPKSSSSGNIEKDELLVIPGDVSFKQVTSCKTGRVVALTFLSSGGKNLYWFQDVGDDDELSKLTPKDKNILDKVNELISPSGEEETEAKEETEETKSINATRTNSGALLPRSSTSSAPTKGANIASQEGIKLPIASISDVLTLELIEKHLDSLSSDQLSDLYAKHLPESTSPTKSDILDVIRSGFFQQSTNKLSELLREGNGAGYLLAQSLKYDYQGEGIEPFLNGVRELGIKEEKEKEQKKESHNSDSKMEDDINQ